MRRSGGRYALMIVMAATLGVGLVSSPALAASDCPAGTTQFKIDRSPSEGTYGDGTLEVQISNVTEGSFDWSSNIAVDSVVVKGGPEYQVNPGGTSGTARSAENPNNGKPYGISHVSFCYSVEEEEEEEESSDEDKEGPKDKDEEGPCDADQNMPGIQPCDEEVDDVGDVTEPKDKDDDVLSTRETRPARPRPPARVRGRVQRAPEPQVQAAPNQLPFTGAALVPIAVVGLGLVALGVLIRRRTRS